MLLYFTPFSRPLRDIQLLSGWKKRQGRRTLASGTTRGMPPVSRLAVTRALTLARFIG